MSTHKPVRDSNGSSIHNRQVRETPRMPLTGETVTHPEARAWQTPPSTKRPGYGHTQPHAWTTEAVP